MPERSIEANITIPAWSRVLLPMLLAAAMTVPHLGKGIFDVDEAASMISACARHLGPCTPAEAIAASARWPDHGWGQAIVFSQWGRLVGWSEFAIRALPWLIGPLTIAWVYRIGRDLFTQRVALNSAFLLATAVLFLSYMQIARSYGPSMLFTAIVLWAYWRVALDDRPVDNRARLVLVLGGTGLFYMQYFGALLVPALALYHLFLVRRSGRWWQPLLLLGLALVLALPQTPDFVRGIAYSGNKTGLHAKALHAPQVLVLFLRYLGNDLLNPRHPVAALLLLAMPLMLLISRSPGRHRDRFAGAVWYLTLASATLLLLMLAANEWARVLEPTRVRYLATLWPSGMLLISLALVHPKFKLLRPPFGLVLILALALFGVLHFVRGTPLVQTFSYWRHQEATVPAMNRVAQELGRDVPRTLLVVDNRLFGAPRQREFYTGVHRGRSMWLSPNRTSGELLHEARNAYSVVFLLRGSREQELQLEEHVDRFLERHWIRHLAWSEGGVTLIRFVTPFSTLLIDRNELVYDQDIRMVGSGILQEEGSLRFLAHLSSEDAHLLSGYSLAVHIIDPGTGERVAQGDVGVGPGTYVRIQSEIDVSGLPAGDYEVHVALYDWQTGERLIATNPLTGAVSDIHVLHHFRIE